MHNFTSMYAATDDALADILATETDTSKVTSAFYREARKRGVVTASGEDEMDREERESEIDDDEN